MSNIYFKIGHVYKVVSHNRGPGRLFTIDDSLRKDSRKTVAVDTLFTVLETYSRDTTSENDGINMTKPHNEHEMVHVAKVLVGDEFLYLTYFPHSIIGDLIAKGELFLLVC